MKNILYTNTGDTDSLNQFKKKHPYHILGYVLQPEVSRILTFGCYFISRKNARIIYFFYFATIGQFMKTPFDQKSQ